MTTQTQIVAPSADSIANILDRNGYVIMTDLFPAKVFDAIDSELKPYFDRTPDGEGLFWGHKTKRMGGLIRKSPSSHPLITHPSILGAVKQVLGRYCSQVQINLTQAIRIGTGERQQVFHKDDELFPVEKNGAQYMINAMWALDDFTEENGATLLIPGSHDKPVERMPNADEIVKAIMPRGSVLLYYGSLLHCGGANTTSRPRTGFVYSYSLGWLRQAENQFLAVPPAVARTLPDELLDLIGYSIHRPNLGWYEGQDPKVALSDDRPDVLAARDYLPPEAEQILREYYEAA
jgi:ectoine hydroxylase-related dioxygenase (phytanoyl-CoA dioxygenase family)